MALQLDVRDFGAAGGKESSVAFQGACDVAAEYGGIVTVPPSNEPYIVNDVSPHGLGVKIRGAGRYSHLRSTTGSVFRFSDNFSQSAMRDMWLSAGAPGEACIRLVDGGSVSSSLFEGLRLAPWVQGSHAIAAEGETWGLYDTVFQSCVYSADGSGLNVPIVKLVDTGGGGICNQNSFIGGRIIGSLGATAPQVVLESQGPNYLYGNTFQGINSEIPVAGFLEARGTHGLTLRDIGLYDAGAVTADLVTVGKHAEGLASRHTNIDNLWRVGHTPDPFYDVSLSGSHAAIVSNSGGAPSGGRIRMANAALLIGGAWEEVTDQTVFHSSIIDPNQDLIKLRHLIIQEEG